MVGDSHERQTHSQQHQMRHYEGTTVVLDSIDQRHCKARLIREWSCSLPGHSVCISTADQEHCQLSDKAIQAWVEALCRGDATIHPPRYVLNCRSSFSVYLRALEEGQCHPDAILAALLRHRHRDSSTTEYDYRGGNLNSSINEACQRSFERQPRRYQAVKAIKWLPTRLLNTQDSDIVIRRRMVQHLLRLRDWQVMRHSEVGKNMEASLFEILEDVIEMSRSCYSRRANKDAAFIGLEIQRWLLSCPGAALTEATAPWLCRLHIILAPIFLGGIYLRKNLPLCDDMSVVQPRLEDLLNIVTDMRLKFPELKTASIVIKLMTKCLQDIPYVHPYTPLLGENLVRIIETVQKLRNLNTEEVNSICLMAAHRLETAQRSRTSCRPWEVVLCAQCEPQEPLMREVGLGDTGLQRLLHALKVLPRPWSKKSKCRRHMVDILGALQHLSQYSWLSDAVDPGLMDLWTNLCRGGILDRLFMDRVETLSTFQSVAYSPVTGRRTIAHKTGVASPDGPLLTISEPTPLEEYYKEQAEDRIKHICMDVKQRVAVTESDSPCQSPPGTSSLLYSNALTSSPTSDLSSFNWSYTTSARSNYSSLVPGIGYLSAKALRWIGEGTLDTVTHAIIWKRTNQHLSCLKRWQKKRCQELDHSTKMKIFNIVYDALNLSDPWGSSRVKNYATSIGIELQQWLISSVDASLRERNTALIVRLHICICATLLATYSESQSDASLQALLDTIQRVPLDVDDPEVTSLATRIIAKEISLLSCSAGRSRVEMSLMQVVETTLQSRSIVGGELDAIGEILDRRLQQSANYNAENCQPWEVAIFAECASQDSTFAQMVFGDHGIPSIVPVLQGILSNQSLSTGELEHVYCIVSVLHQLSRHAWVAKAVDPGVIGLLINVFSRTDVESRFRLRYLAIQAVQNIVSCQGKSRSSLADIMETPLYRHSDDYSSVIDGYFNESSTSLNSLHTLGRDETVGNVQVIHPGTDATPAVHLELWEPTVPHGAPAAVSESVELTTLSGGPIPPLTCRTSPSQDITGGNSRNGISMCDVTLESGSPEDGNNVLSYVASLYPEDADSCDIPTMPGGWIEAGSW